MSFKLILEKRKFALKKYWKTENAQNVIRDWCFHFSTNLPTRLTIYRIRDKVEETGSVTRGGVLEDVLGLWTHILKSLALASKVKSLTLRPQVLENWPVLRSRTALFFELLKFCGAPEKFFGRRFFLEIAFIFINFCEDLFVFWRALALVSLVLGLEPCVLDSTSVCYRCPTCTLLFVAVCCLVVKSVL